MKKAIVLAALALALIPVAGCGDDEPSKADTFKSEYEPVNDRILAVGQELGAGLEGASTSTDDALAKKFNDLAKKLGSLQKDVEALEPPDDLVRATNDLATALGATQKQLEAIADAAEKGNAAAAKSATIALAKPSGQVNTAQNELAEATGADKGGS